MQTQKSDRTQVMWSNAILVSCIMLFDYHGTQVVLCLIFRMDLAALFIFLWKYGNNKKLFCDFIILRNSHDLSLTLSLHIDVSVGGAVGPRK